VLFRNLGEKLNENKTSTQGIHPGAPRLTTRNDLALATVSVCVLTRTASVASEYSRSRYVEQNGFEVAHKPPLVLTARQRRWKKINCG
jgi:hypothetical protein